MNKNIALLALTGILTLAACGQNTTDTGTGTNNSTYSLGITVNGANGTISVKNASGAVVGTVTGSGTVTGLANGTYTLSSSAVTGYTTPANQTVTISSANTTATVNYVATGPGTGTNPTTPTGTLTITSPSNGASVTVGQPINVTFSTSGSLTGVQCTIGSNTAVNASTSSTGGFCTVTPTVAGSNLITVTGKDASGATVSTSVNVNAAAAPTATPSPITFDPTQELTLTNEGIVKDADDGWRRIGQGVSTPGNPDTNVDVYVKGTVNVSYTAANGSKVEIILARTTGSDVPTSDDIQAGDVLRVVTSSTGPVTAQLDTRRLAEYEAVREWLVFRVNGTQISYQPVIADNKGPQQADPEFSGLQNGYSNLLRDYNGTEINWARGDVRLFTTNPSLQDREYGQAPVGSSFVQRRPSGFESIRYYLVPDTAFNNKGLADSDEMRRAKAIKSVAAATSAPILEPGSDRSAAFNTLIGSTTATNAQAVKTAGISDNVNYRIYTIVRDQLGNETASAGYETIRFDNVGPSIGNSGLRDISALPFPSLEPTRCLSDLAAVNLTGFTDAAGGVGLIGNAAFNIGGITLTNGEQFDTNRLADGTYPLNYSNVTDALGNPPVNAVNTTVTIDNTDPTVNFNRPALQSAVQSGERLSVEASASDDGCGVYEARLFWDTNTSASNNGGAIDDAITTEAIGHPVQFARKTNTDAANSRAMSLNQGWNALQLPSTSGLVQLRALVVDRAGNATLVSTPVVVTAKTGRLPNNNGIVTVNFARPTLGSSDGYRRNQAAAFGANSNAIAPVGTNGTTLVPNNSAYSNEVPSNSGLDNNLTLDAKGTFTVNGFTDQGLPAATPNQVEKINAVLAYGRFDATRWGQIRSYQLTTDPTLRSAGRGNLSNQRSANWNVRNPWIALGDSATADNKQQFTFTSDLLNDFYNDRTFANTGADNGGPVNDGTLPIARVSYDQFNSVVTDTAGSYSFFGEEVQR